jgi:16S rRNA (guanine527-N7)-methyltransferase
MTNSAITSSVIIITAMEKLKSGAETLGIILDDEQIGRFEIYYRELVAWNERINLTGITDYEAIQIKHFLDSLTIAQAYNFRGRGEGLKVIDVGTGAGLPGIPLKIVYPKMCLALLEATAGKTKFLEYLIGRLGLKDVEIINGRAEDIARLPRYREKYGLVLSRAVAPLPALAELTIPFISIGGMFVAQKKGDIAGELESAGKAVEVLGGRVKETKPVKIEGPDDDRCLIVIEKIKETPEKYPRRNGMPEKRPITG